jgi:hypothetical protein
MPFIAGHNEHLEHEYLYIAILTANTIALNILYITSVQGVHVDLPPLPF